MAILPRDDIFPRRLVKDLHAEQVVTQVNGRDVVREPGPVQFLHITVADQQVELDCYPARAKV